MGASHHWTVLVSLLIWSKSGAFIFLSQSCSVATQKPFVFHTQAKSCVLINFLLVCLKRCKLNTVEGSMICRFRLKWSKVNSEVGGNHLKLMSSFNHCVPKLLAGFVARRTPRGQNGNSACENHAPNPQLVCYTSNELTLKRDFIFDSISFSTCSFKQDGANSITSRFF